MNLDLLISKYIDGELTAAEDEQLRRFLKEDPVAREEFDTLLEIHLTMLEDANTIVVPASVKRATEDRVMMAILNDSPKIIPIKKSYFEYSKIAAVAAFLIFAFIFQINDKFYQFTNVNQIEDMQAKKQNIDTPNNEIPSNKNNVAVTQNNENKVYGESITSENQAIISEVAVVSNYSIENMNNLANHDKPQTNNIALDEIEITSSTSDNFNENNNLITTNSSMELAAPNDMVKIDGFYNHNVSDINLTTLISYDFIRNGLNTYDNTAIKNYSQSISYSINKNSSIGLEFGMTEFYYPNTRYVRVNSSIGTNSKVEVLDPVSDNFILVPIQVKESEKNYWGTVFYEQNILRYGELDVDGRLGIGSNSDGFLGISRVVAKYNIMSGLYLSAGIEGRMFSYKLPLKNTRGIANNLSYVWGVYFQF